MGSAYASLAFEERTVRSRLNVPASWTLLATVVIMGLSISMELAAAR